MANKFQLKKIARIHAASVIRNTECTFAFGASGLTEDEIVYLDSQMQYLSDDMLQGFPPFADANEIVKFVLKST